MFQIVTCAECGTSFPKEQNEYNRRIRANGTNARFFCNSKCAGMHLNRERQRPFVTKVCQCGNSFVTNTGSTFCSRQCASLFSMTDARYAAMIAASANTRFTGESIAVIANSLRVREWEKYIDMHDAMNNLTIPHCFEFPLLNSRWIFDLALYDFRTFVEFDEGYHKDPAQIVLDIEKNQAANSAGWNVFRIDTTNVQKPYPVNLLSSFIEHYI